MEAELGLFLPCVMEGCEQGRNSTGLGTDRCHCLEGKGWWWW